MSLKKRILIAPLDWGLGHATRCIPIIRLLIKKNAEVIIAVDGRPYDLLKLEFPNLEFIRLKGYDITYPSIGPMVLKMALSVPKILSGIKAEHEALKQIIKQKKIDVVISDNRFGLWNKEVKSIFITHQLMIKSPLGEKQLHKKNLDYISKFDECWIPDTEGTDNLSGDLSHKYPLPANAFFIGALSRFSYWESRPISTGEKEEMTYDAMIIISGPEPQRGALEFLIMKQLLLSKMKILVVMGRTEDDDTITINQNIKMVTRMSSQEMEEAIMKSKIVIARSGYSTIMDLAALGKKAIFVPTPGQTEQEYLAEEFKQKKIAFFQKQSEFDIQQALIEAENYTGFEAILNTGGLEKRIDLL